MSQRPIIIQFIHESPTPHNNYLLDALASYKEVRLFRHYLVSPATVPGRPWNTLDAGEVQAEHISWGYSKLFDWRLIKLAIFDRDSVFFVIGWEHPILALLLIIIGLRKRPLIMWDDGPTDEALRLIKQLWRPKQALKALLITLINRAPGTYFHTGSVTALPIKKLGIQPHKLESLPFFVRPGRVEIGIRERHLESDEDVLLLAGGRFIVRKGYDVFIESLHLLQTHGIERWKAVIIGSGPQEASLREQVARHGLEGRVDFIAWAEPSVFADYIHSCDVFVAPARFDHFPTTIIAAMQAGKCVVATSKVGSAVEFIKPGDNGYIVPPGDTSTLGQYLANLIQNPELRLRLGNAASEEISHWPVERGARQILDAAQRALGISI